MGVLIPNKREALARALTGLGVVQLLERLARRPGILIATYHRIGRPAENPYYDGVLSASPEAFRAEVRHFRDRFRLIGLDELEALAESGMAVDRPTALITFDDGYRDNIDVALPILEELGAPAAFFLATEFLNAPRLPWWDHVALVLKETDRARIDLEWPEPLALVLEPGTRSDAIARVIGLYLDGKVDDEPRFRAHLEERAGVAVDDEARGRALFVTWDDVRRLSASGMAIGSHSRTHRNLARLSEADQRFELAESRRILEQEVGRPVRTLAYPYGWPGAYTNLTQRLAREEGYRLAFSSSGGVNRPRASDPLALKRLNIGFRDSPPLLRARTALQVSFGKSFL